MVERNIYISIFIVGTVFAVLTILSDQGIETALTIEYFTFLSLLLLRLIDEWLYYRQYQAPTASVIFLLLLTILALFGSLVAAIATLGDSPLLQTLFIESTMNFFGFGNYYLFFNLFGIIFALPFYILLLFLLRRYYSGQYSSIFIFRKKYPIIVVIIFNAIIFLLLGLLWTETREVEISSLGFLIADSLILIQYYVFPVAIISLRPILSSSGSTSRSPSRRESRTVSRRSLSVPNQRSSLSSISHSSPTTPQRSSTTRTQRFSSSASSQSSSSTMRRSSPTLSRSTSSISRSIDREDIKIVPAVEIERSRIFRQTKSLSPAIIERLTPVGRHLSQDDFRCIFCYEFPIESHHKVVICPHCRYPAHELEFRRWQEVSQICSRCNKSITDMKMIRVSGSSYKKIINYYSKKRN
ncbi:MAG: hypothetical protein ACFFCQ_02455 [Promethearchaeota archaeon]